MLNTFNGETKSQAFQFPQTRNYSVILVFFGFSCRLAIWPCRRRFEWPHLPTEGWLVHSLEEATGYVPGKRGP